MIATRKPLLTRRRVIAAAVLLVLAVAGMLGMSDGDSANPVTVTFVRFQPDADGTNTLAVLSLTNRSHKDYWLAPGDGWKSALEFRWLASDQSTGPVLGGVRTPPRAYLLGAGSNILQSIRLLQGGQAVEANVFCYPVRRTTPAFLRGAQELWWRVSGSPNNMVRATCEQEIQCPNRLADGTVEPPRVVPKDSKTP
jgi:hypothetical protein